MNDDPRAGWTSASNAHYDARCPGRHQAQKGLTEPESNAAQFGDSVHAAFEGQDVDLSLTQETLLERALEREKRVLERFPNSKFEESREIRLWAETSTWRHSGQIDRLFVDKNNRLAVVEDLKSLRGEVPESSENMQLRDLAVLVWLNCEVDTVVVFINQPLAGGGQKKTTYPTPVLKQAWSYMRARINISNDPNANRIPGIEQCKFCRARGVCKEAIEWAKISVPQALVKAESDYREIVARIRPEALAEVYAKSGTIAAILDAVKQRLMEMPDDKLNELGLQRKSGHFRESINNNVVLFERLSEIGCDPRAVEEAMFMSKTNLAKLVRQASGKNGRELEILMDKILLGIVDKTQTSDRLIWTI